MQLSRKVKVYSGLLVLACILQASHTATISKSTTSPSSNELMCYICENCAEVTKDTPLEECNEEFFNKRTTMTPVTTTTTEATTELTTLDDNTTTTDTTSTTHTTVDTTTPGSTEPPVPTPPTVGPVQTTTGAPTPPNVGTVEMSLSDMFRGVGEGATSEMPQALALTLTDYTYHCYRVQKQVNGSMQTERGCSRVTTMESVCGQLQSMNNDTKINRCFPCANSQCNSSSALTVSAVALIFALVAALLRRN